MTTTTPANREALGSAERIINMLLTYQDHLVHNRPGLITPDRQANIGVRWQPVVYKAEGDATPKQKVVYQLTKVGKKSTRTRIGVLGENNVVRADNGTTIGTYRSSGLYPEVAAWIYGQIADVWKLDNEFAARWASFAFTQDHRDLKVALAAFMLVQSRKGDPVRDAGKIIFCDEDYRDIGEAMTLLYRKDGKDLNPKLLLRIHDLLALPEIAKINRDLGFGASTRHPFFGRWSKAVTKWLQYREENPKLLEGLVSAGFRRTVMELVRRVGYKPQTPTFFAKLRWKQGQAKDGRRTIAIGQAIEAAQTWEGLTEGQICERIMAEKPNWKVIASRVPAKIGITRAIAAAAIESNALSNKDLIIITPTLEELGLLTIAPIKARWDHALKEADDMRAANIARNVQSQAVKDQLQEAATNATQKAVAEVLKQIRVYFIIDISSSMQSGIEVAKEYIAKLLPAFPLDVVHVAVFNTGGREVTIKHASAAGVENAFRGIRAEGGTDYGAGVKALQKYTPKADEDAIIIFVGDEEAPPFDQAVRVSGINPIAFGFLKIQANSGAPAWRARTYGTDHNVAVRQTATNLGIPCFMIEEQTFADPYAIPRTLRNLIASTPVAQVTARSATVPRRLTLVDQILQTELLKKPVWALG